jgi:hypothetical protein
MEDQSFVYIIYSFLLYAVGVSYALWSILLRKLTITERQNIYAPLLIISIICFLFLGFGAQEIRNATLPELWFILTMIFHVGLFMVFSIIFFKANKHLPVSGTTLYFLLGTLVAVSIFDYHIFSLSLVATGIFTIVLSLIHIKNLFFQHIRFVSYLIWGIGTYSLIFLPYLSKMCFTENCTAVADWQTILGSGFAIIYILWFGLSILLFFFWPFFYWRGSNDFKQEAKKLRASLFASIAQELQVNRTRSILFLLFGTAGFASGSVIVLFSDFNIAATIAISAFIVSVFEIFYKKPDRMILKN